MAFKIKGITIVTEEDRKHVKTTWKGTDRWKNSYSNDDGQLREYSIIYYQDQDCATHVKDVFMDLNLCNSIIFLIFFSARIFELLVHDMVYKVFC